MMKLSITALLLCLSCLPGFGNTTPGNSFKIGSFHDRGEAEALISTLPLKPIEGIWEYPADEIALMVIRDNTHKGRYRILHVESIDCRLFPGMELGWIEESPDKSKFKIYLCSHLCDGLPGDRRQGLATLSANGESLIIEMPEVKFKISPSIIFPTLWNKLRLSLRVNSTNPLDKLPEGWIKTFPGYELEGTTPDSPRYL